MFWLNSHINLPRKHKENQANYTWGAKQKLGAKNGYGHTKTSKGYMGYFDKQNSSDTSIDYSQYSQQPSGPN